MINVLREKKTGCWERSGSASKQSEKEKFFKINNWKSKFKKPVEDLEDKVEEIYRKVENKINGETLKFKFRLIGILIREKYGEDIIKELM